jgi:hypothetical protein
MELLNADATYFSPPRSENRAPRVERLMKKGDNRTEQDLMNQERRDNMITHTKYLLIITHSYSYTKFTSSLRRNVKTKQQAGKNVVP